MITTAYDLPYEVLVGRRRDIVAGGALRISLSPRSRLDPSAAKDFASIFTAFDILAQTGALSGPELPPWESGIETSELVKSDRLDWQLTGCRIDERAIVILAQSFLLSAWRAEIARIEIGEPPFTRLAQQPDATNPYPTIWSGSAIPIVRSEGLSDSIRIIVEMRRATSAEETEMLSNLLFNCATAIGMGLYGIAPVEPNDCGLLFADELEAIGDDLILSLDKFRAHVSAIDAFLNVCIAFNHGLDAIGRIEVE